MILRLSKRVNEQVFYDGTLFFNRYDVFDGSELMGQFFYAREQSYFTYDNRKIRIKIRPSFFRMPKISIIEEKTGEMIGLYKPMKWFPEISYTRGLSLYDVPYEFRQLTSDVKYTPFEKGARGHYKFRLSGEAEKIIYSFKIEVPMIDLFKTVPHRPFDGYIEFNGSNKLLLFAGLFLIEKSLRYETVPTDKI